MLGTILVALHELSLIYHELEGSISDSVFRQQAQS